MAFRNEEKKEFKDLTPEQRSEIVEAWLNGNAELLIGNNWSCIEFQVFFKLNPNAIYRVAVKATKVFWDKIPDKYTAYSRGIFGEEYLCSIENDMEIPPDLAHLIRELGSEAPADSLILRGE